MYRENSEENMHVDIKAKVGRSLEGLDPPLVLTTQSLLINIHAEQGVVIKMIKD